MILYYIAFAMVLLLVFVLLPLCYFFFDAGATNFDAAPLEVISRLTKYACARSAGVMLLGPLLVLLGYICSQERAHVWGEEKGWVLEAEESSPPLVSGFQFAISTVGVVGLLFWVLSVADGLIAIAIGSELVVPSPFSWNVCRATDAEETPAIDAGENDPSKNGGRSSASRLTLYENGRLGGQQDDSDRFSRDENWIQTLLPNVKPCCPRRFQWVLRIPWAVCVLTLTMLLGVSEGYNCVDRLRFASFDLGFILHDQPAASRWETGVFSALTPLDALLLLLSSRLLAGFELCLDFSVVVLLTALVVAASFNTYGRDGLRCLCGEVQKIKPAKTQPQTLVLAAAYTLINSVALCIVLLSVTPQWSTFGRQTRHSSSANTGEADPAIDPFVSAPLVPTQQSQLPCRLDDLRSHDGYLFKDECRPTQLAVFFNSSFVQYPEVGGMVLTLECFFVANFIRCFVLRVREGKYANRRAAAEESLLGDNGLDYEENGQQLEL
jgi:LMBR1 domain-containing protein 1